ncbi:zinc-ribbon domain-containing protein [Micromonospora sp. M71_S20]|uniref:zinc-ribbon domain-containing protein n=1 Tax=Micromonospora sp. M71_S20 TaxID=592872 RepID=UPI000EABB86E
MTGRPLRETHPRLLDQIDPDLNGDLDVAALSAGSGRKVWWRCPKGPHHVGPAPVSGRT